MPRRHVLDLATVQQWAGPMPEARLAKAVAATGSFLRMPLLDRPTEALDFHGWPWFEELNGFDLPSARDAAAAWDRWTEERERSPRLRIVDWSRGGVHITPSVLQLLRHRAVSQSVFFDWTDPATRLTWDLPIRVRVLDADANDPIYGPVDRWRHAERVTGRECDLLVIRGSLRTTLPRLLSTGRQEADVVLVLGGYGGGEHRALVDAVRIPIGAGGVAVLQEPAHDPETALDVALYELAHDLYLDEALNRAFEGRVDAWLSPAVLEAAHPRRSGQRLVERLASEPPDTVLPPLSRELVDALRYQNPNFQYNVGDMPRLEPFQEQVRQLVRDGDFQHETEESRSIAEMRRWLRDTKPEMAAVGNPRSEPRGAVPRFLQGQVRQVHDGEETLAQQELSAAHEYQLAVFVGPEERGFVRGETAFREDLVQEHDGLDVLLAYTPVPDASGIVQPAIVEPLRIEPTGATRVVKFPIQPGRTDRWAARVSVLYQNRVIQTTLFSANVGEQGTRKLALEAVDAHLEDLTGPVDRTPFDGAVVFNDNDGAAGAYTYVDHEVRFAGLSGTEKMLEEIKKLLGDKLAPDASRGYERIGAQRFRAVLIKLARAGRSLWGPLRHAWSVDPRSSTDHIRLHVVDAQPDKLVPVELAYFLATPKVDAKLCPRWKEALAVGHCVECFGRDPVEQGKYVCPVGFLGLRAVIERGKPGTPAQTPAIPLSAAASLGASGNIDKGTSLDPKPSVRLREAVGAVASTVHQPTNLPTWDQLVGLPPDQFPKWFVLLPHTSEKSVYVSDSNEKMTEQAMEIGDDKNHILQPDLQEHHLTIPGSASRPLVLMVGCNTALAWIPFQSWSAHLTYQGAGTVLATMCTITGPNAAMAVKRLVDALAKTADGRGFGEVLLEVKRTLLLERDLLPLTFATFGNVDVRLEAS